MALLINTIFLKENEKDIFLSLKNQGIDTKVFESKLADLFNRVYNNFVGYYLFKQDAILYKLIILPKSIAINSETKEKDFVNYLLHYHRVNNKYSFDKTKKIEDSLLSLAFENNNDDENSHLPLEEFEFYKYKSILESIEKFFKKHKNYKRVKVDYASQSVKYKLNLQKNIQELDKTKLHQTRTIDVMYSLISTISYTALKLFISNKLNDFDDEKKKNLLSQCKSINSLIVKKYNLDKSYKLTLSKLNSFKIEKVFKAKKETQELLIAIKSLFGFEQMYEDDKISVTNNYDLATTSFFINPITFYEWYVYDILKKFAEFKEYEIRFDKNKSNNTKKEYFLNSKRQKALKRSSNPDYILIDEKNKIKIIIDAKWKNIDELSDISSSDYLKLKFDSDILEDEIYATSSYFVYPHLYDYNDVLNIQIDENNFFDFNAMQIDMNFEKDKNSLDFSYDYTIIEAKIEKEKQERLILVASKYFIDKIDSDRRDFIEELLNSSEIEDREEVFSQLDEQLLECAEQINETIEEHIISDEVLEILARYDDVLEEDSKKFLKSSSSIYNYYKDKNHEYFDYSMSGIGLWKLIELELNTSFVWYLRIQSNICDSSCPWTSISSSRRSITQELDNGKRVRLNKFDDNDNSKLQGLMLGGIELLLEDSSTIEDFKDISHLDRTFFSDKLFRFLTSVKNIRNEHAHIKAMGLNKFEELYKLLFLQKDGLSNIEKLLEMKRTINKNTI